MIGRLALAAPLLVASIALGLATGSISLAATIGAIALVASLVGERWEMDRGRQLVASAMGGAIGWAAAAILYEDRPGTLHDVWARIAAAAILAAAARGVAVRAAGGRAATIALAFAGLLAVGEMRGAPGYALSAAAFALASLAALRAADPDRPPLVRVSFRDAVGGAMVLVVAGTLGVGAVVGLRRAHAWALRRAGSVAFAWKPRTGFSETLDLGALDGLLDSDDLVLRVRGPRVDHLRGLAYDVYEPGRWVRSQATMHEVEESWSEEPRGDVVEIAAVSERVERLFLPLGARAIASTPPVVRVDELGAVRRATKRGLVVAKLVRGERDRAPVAPPSSVDLLLPTRVRFEVAPLAAAWTTGATTTVEKLDAIERHLASEYVYARAFERPFGVDPALAFLLHDKRGHCEYFATAMALVARAAGIPARVVTGYRVAERSAVGDYWLVRERNAHAWVEAWVEGAGWTTRDPTPERFVPQDQERESSLGAALVDAVRLGWDRLSGWLGRRSIGETSIAAAAGLAILGVIVARGVRRKPSRRDSRRDDELPLDFAETLLDALAKGGFSRADGEPIERLAERVPDPRARELLLAYAALRYGGVGDARSIAADVARFVAGRPSVSK